MTSYGALLRTPRIARLYASMIVARMSIGIDGIATVLFLRHEGRSFAAAGAAAGALALGSALGAPELLVLDEPTVGLDPLLRRELWGLFHRLADEGRTLFVSSHVMDEAAHCDELILLRDGQVLAHESPDRILAETGAADLESAFVTLISEEVPA